MITTEPIDDDHTRSAMLLTEQEWTDLAEMARHYKRATEWAETDRTLSERDVADLFRKRALAERIIDAST